MIAVYPGSFDPVTLGHVNIIRRGASLFDHLIVAVLNNSAKQPLFSVAKRVELLTQSLIDIPGVTVTAFSGLLVDFVQANAADVILRGLRNAADLESEATNATVNRALGSVETLYLPADPSLIHLSSRIVREISGHLCKAKHIDDAVLSTMVPPAVIAALRG